MDLLGGVPERFHAQRNPRKNANLLFNFITPSRSLIGSYSKPFDFNCISHKNLVRTLTLNSTLASFSFVNDISDCFKSF